MLELIIFLVGSLGVVLLSPISLVKPRSHGFYRFLAFETTLLLAVSNLHRWFVAPLSLHQIVSWVLLAGSIILALHGFYLLRTAGRPTGGLETTTQLVTRGAYRVIRHPLYSSLLLVTWGIFFKNPAFTGAVLALLATVFLTATAKVEETENLQQFGPAYRTYMTETKMFIPYLF